MTWTRRHARSLLTLLAVLLLGLGVFALTARPAAAADEDTIDSFVISYTVEPSGTLHVKETIVYRFGDNSGRHGIQRQLITREPYGSADQDQVFEYSNIDVSSPSGAPDQVEQQSESSNDDRNRSLVLRVGDPNATVDTPTATYVLQYDVVGAMRNSKGYDEFYWDATGFIDTPPTKQVSVSVQVPGGVFDEGVSCFAGRAATTSTTPCSSKRISAGKAEFTQASLGSDEGLTVGVKIEPGLVADNAPHLVPSAALKTPAEKAAAATGLGVGAASLVGSPLVGWLWWRRKGRDKRYIGLPPGTVPYAGQTAEVGYHDKDIQIPVAFSPPKIPVAEAGLLVDGQVDTRETAATLIDLAVRGAITVQGESKDDYQVTLVDPGRATAPHEVVLLQQLFQRQPAGAVADLSRQGSITGAHNAMASQVREQVQRRGWFTAVPSAKGKASFGFGAVIVLGFVLFQVAREFWWLVLFAAPIAITIAVVRSKLRRGQRTPDGRAVADQVEGFKLYLSTAEADQLRFEEGEDIFSKYLPWAIAFDLADRWAKICGDLVAAGRLPNETPYWYSGTGSWTAFNVGYLMGGMTTAATPVPTPSSSGSGSGTGFGGGSSFGGGGFSGGGGGGGGTSSW